MSSARHRGRSTIRVRLALLYAVAFFLAGGMLITVLYLFLRESLDHRVTRPVGIGEHLERSPGARPGTSGFAPEQLAELHEQFRQDREDTLDTMLVVSVATLGAFGVVAGAFGWLLAGRALAPLQQITATARRVADRSLHERIGLDGPDDEIKDLADTFDAMLERLDHSFDSQRRFVANASHELRTPLALSRTLIEVALDDGGTGDSTRRLGASLLAVNRRQERLIDGLLTLASSEQDVADRRPVDLADLAGQVVTESSDAARTAGVDLRARLGPARVEGDPVLLERLVQNLVDNAVRYNVPEEGEITVSTGMVDDIVRLTVENTGPPVPPYAVPVLFEPFRRLPDGDRIADSTDPTASRGAGLGLSIVRSVTHAHGGEVHARAPARRGADRRGPTASPSRRGHNRGLTVTRSWATGSSRAGCAAWPHGRPARREGRPQDRRCLRPIPTCAGRTGRRPGTCRWSSPPGSCRRTRSGGCWPALLPTTATGGRRDGCEWRWALGWRGELGWRRCWNWAGRTGWPAAGAATARGRRVSRGPGRPRPRRGRRSRPG